VRAGVDFWPGRGERRLCRRWGRWRGRSGGLKRGISCDTASGCPVRSIREAGVDDSMV